MGRCARPWLLVALACAVLPQPQPQARGGVGQHGGLVGAADLTPDPAAPQHQRPPAPRSPGRCPTFSRLHPPRSPPLWPLHAICQCDAGLACEGAGCRFDAFVPQSGQFVHHFAPECPSCRCRPPIAGAAPSRTQALYQQRGCAVRAVYGAVGSMLRPGSHKLGCSYAPFGDFEHWAASTGCTPEPLDAEGLTVHTLWMGPLPEAYVDRVVGFIDSFLVTQDLSRSRLLFWYTEASAALSQVMGSVDERRFAGKVEFRRFSLDAARQPTCVVHMDLSRASVEGKTDLARLLILHKLGGIWVDLDSILLRDLRPVFEFAGEFAVRWGAMQFNNAVLGLRKGSFAAWKLIELACTIPWPGHGVPISPALKARTGHMFKGWYWNTGPLSIFHKLYGGLMPFPLSFFDPGFGCHGAALMRPLALAPTPNPEAVLADHLELLHGAFVLHTRILKNMSLSAHSPMAALLASLREQVAHTLLEAQPLVGTTRRSAASQTDLKALYSRLRYSQPKADDEGARLVQLLFPVTHVRQFGVAPEARLRLYPPSQESHLFGSYPDGTLRPVEHPGICLTLVGTNGTVAGTATSAPLGFARCGLDPELQRWVFQRATSDTAHLASRELPRLCVHVRFIHVHAEARACDGSPSQTILVRNLSPMRGDA